MQYLNTLLGLLSKTSSRDTILRLFQYLTLHSVDHLEKGATFNVYTQMRRTRKILRFLRTLQHTSEIRKQIGAFTKERSTLNGTILRVLVILEHLFTVLFFMFDHRVVLGELEVIDKANVDKYYPLSMKMYRWQNIIGALKCVAKILVVVMEGKYEGELLDMEKGQKIIGKLAVEFIRNVLDIFVAYYYLNKPAGKAGAFGVIGVVTSIIGIGQALNVI